MPTTKKAKSKIIRPLPKAPPVVKPPTSVPGNTTSGPTTEGNKTHTESPSYGCSFYRLTLLPTPISPMGTGWSARCNIGDYFSNGNILPTFGLGGSTVHSLGKLLPSSNPNMPGTYVESSSLTGYFGLEDHQLSPLYKDIAGGHVRIGNASTKTSTLVGLGNFSTANGISWNTLSILQDNEWAIALATFSPNFFIRPSIGLGIESILNFNKPENSPTLRDNARNMIAKIGIEFEYRELTHSLSDREDYPEIFQARALVNHIYSDLLSGAAAFINYKSIDKDIAKTKTFIEENIGSQDNAQESSATSDTPALLSLSGFLGARTAGNTRRQFKRIRGDWQDGILSYHLGKTLLVGALTAASDRPDVLTPTAFSSVRTLVDLYALRHSKSPREALAYHLLIGGGMMVLGAAANSSPYGKALAQAGMEGFTASTMSPDSFYDSTWVHATMYEYQPLSLYNRSGTKINAKSSRPSVRIETSFKDSAIYTASEISTPMADIRSIGERSATLVTSNEGQVKYANTEVQTPSVVISTVGLRATSYNKGDRVSVNGNIGIGPQLEWSNAGIEPGVGSEVGVGIAFHPSETWSLGFSGRCSAAKFIDGYSTSCGLGINLNLPK